MAISKIILNGVTQMDVTQDTVATSNLLNGYTATGADGVQITGSYVPSGVSLQSKTKSYTPTESAQSETVSADSGYDGLSSVNISIGAISSTYVGSGVTRRSTSDITTQISTNGNYYQISYESGYYSNGGTINIGLASLPNPTISVDSSGLITASLTTTTSKPYKAQTVTATEQLTLRNSDSLTVSGATVTAPAGYYAEAASKSVTTMSLPTSVAASATSGYTSKATISRSTSDQYINIAPGYNSAGGYYKISAVANGSATPAASISGTSATITTGTNTITLTKTVSNTPQVSAGYVSSGTTGNSSVSLTASVTVNPTPTASGATVTVPAGYYSSQTTKSVSNGSASAPTSISGTSASVTTGTNTLTFTKTVSVTPVVSAGYVSSGTATNSSVSLTASVTTKAATTYHPSTTAQSISSGTYLTGAQTIAAVTTSNLSASNIVSGVTIKVGDSSDDDCVASVTGNVVLQNYYTGSSAPSSSLGQNGDIYIQQ